MKTVFGAGVLLVLSVLCGQDAGAQCTCPMPTTYQVTCSSESCTQTVTISPCAGMQSCWNCEPFWQPVPCCSLTYWNARTGYECGTAGAQLGRPQHPMLVAIPNCAGELVSLRVEPAT